MPELVEEELARVREDLARRIQLPGLAGARRRARTLRRRRVLASGGGALGGVLLVLMLVATGIGADRPPVTPGASPPAGPYWQGSGITLHGLEASVVDQPGSIRSLEFNDAIHGFVLTLECRASCVAAVAATKDRGRTWTNWPLPESTVDNAPLTLIPLGEDGVVLRGQTSWFGRNQHWSPVPTYAPPTITQIPDGAALAVSTTGTLEVWRSDGSLARLPNPPGFVPRYTEPIPADDGSRWLGGTTQAGQPATARSVDNGQTWQVTPLPTAGSSARVSTLGREAYASVETERPGTSTAIEAVYRSVDGGPFTLFAKDPGTAVGDVVPLLDGRLLTAGPDWYVGTTNLAPASGSLPWIGQIQRTPGGWVAYDLFAAGWAAVSRDGVDWQKVNVR